MSKQKKYIFTVDIWQQPGTSIVELEPVLYSGDTDIFIESLELARIAAWHTELRNHSPFMNPGWLSRAVDTWEEQSNWVVYDSAKDAELGAFVYLNQLVDND